MLKPYLSKNYTNFWKGGFQKNGEKATGYPGFQFFSVEAQNRVLDSWGAGFDSKRGVF